MLYTIGFIVTFVIGGLSGVLLAMPPVDYLMHNTTFLIAHFHNMIIPGVLFGYLAGYMFWVPKAFGFKLNEKWGGWSFWCWIIGFYLAFMPLYVLGLLGMPRRMEHYEIAAWQPHLIIAAIGAFIIFLGIVCLGVQLVVSIRDRKKLVDLTGDPWNGRSLEWLTSSPAAPYNFAVLPQVQSIDAFWDMKERGVAYRRPDRYTDIVLPRNSFIGPFIGGVGFVFGFAMIWYIWWLAILSLAAIALAIIIRASDDDTYYTMSADEVKAIEDARFAELAKAPRRAMADEPGFTGAAVPEASI
jgi:cytochrome o ubiquinol oxidase subunit 1